MIYTKMMDSLNEGEIPQEAAVEQPVEPTVDIEKVTVEEVEDFNDGLVEGSKIDSEIKMESMKFDKSFTILSHVHKYGVDRSFLNICNNDNKLATDLGIVLPASEDFEIYGNPNSNVSKKVIAAMESGDSLWSKFWEWIKGVASKLWNWVKSFFSKAWEFIKKLLGIGTSKLEKISDITQALKEQGIKTIEVDKDFMNIGERLKDSILERQDKMIRNREILNKVKGLIANSYKCIKDVMTKDNIKKRTEELEAFTKKLKEYSGNIWDATKTVASETSSASGKVFDTIGNVLGDVWDSAVDTFSSAEYSINRYHNKTVKEQARREYKDARNKSNDALSDWMGSTYENVAKEGTFRNDTRFTFRPQPYIPEPRNNGNNNNGNTQQCPMNLLETATRDLLAQQQRQETDAVMQQRIQAEVQTMVGDFNNIISRLNGQNSPTDTVSTSVRDSAQTILGILNGINTQFTTAVSSGLVMDRSALEAYDRQLLALNRFVHNGVNAARTMIYNEVLTLQHVDVNVTNVRNLRFDPTNFTNAGAARSAPFDVNRLAEPSFGMNRTGGFNTRVSSWNIHVPVGLQGRGNQQVLHLTAQLRVDDILRQNRGNRFFYHTFADNNTPVTIHYYIPPQAWTNQPVPGTSLQLGNIGGSPTQTTVRFV